MKMSSSVGRGGTNAPGDVRLIQQLLNDWLASRNSSLLKVDAVVGPKTLAAIESFQRLNGCVVDCRVDPSQQTLHKLLNGMIARVANGMKSIRTFQYSGHNVPICTQIQAVDIIEAALERLAT